MHIGDQAPNFELTDENGVNRNLQELLADGPVVLYFYPAAMTPGCTAEGCHFRDLQAEFSALGARRVGVSADDVTKQKQFAEKYNFDFPLLSDVDRRVAEAYGVRRSFGPLPTKRATFVIGADGRILDIIKSEVRMSIHADRALKTLTTAAPG
ncbi:MAG: peroxiredoxin [Actinomycetota bacterium]|nr:peroxiredoxin [Actinomycetota bacterium]